MIVVGVAGHVDHGKTSLTRMLTGVDTDRLAVEKARGMSVDLGFAPLDLPDGTRVSLIDVPGHQRFIKNMLAGSTGMDGLLLIVAADDGVMPQTREHLHIASFLGVSRLVVAVSKTDLCDAARIAEVRRQIDELMDEVGCEPVAIVKTSISPPKGLDSLRAALGRLASGAESYEATAPVRLPLDRSFVIPGVGVVVTGTLWQGKITEGDALTVFPGGKRVRARSLQVHGQRIRSLAERARLAINLSGISRGEATRGSVIVGAEGYKPTAAADVRMTLAPWAPTVTNGTTFQLFHGTAQTNAVAVFVGPKSLAGGQEAFVRLRLADPLVLAPLDRFVLRLPGPAATVGGGIVADPWPPPKAFPHNVELLESLLSPDSAERLIAWLRRLRRPLAASELSLRLRLSRAEAAQLAGGLEQVDILGDSYALSEQIATWSRSAADFVEKAIGENPLSRGVSKERVREECLPGLTQQQADCVLAHLKEDGLLIAGKAGLLPASRMEGAAEALLNRLAELLAADGFSPRSPGELAQAAGLAERECRALLARLREGGAAVEIAGMFFAAEKVDQALGLLREHLDTENCVTVSDFRRLLGTSRKFALPLLEYFDRQGVTTRKDGIRIPGPAAEAPRRFETLG